jgi:hypothetical protein
MLDEFKLKWDELEALRLSITPALALTGRIDWSNILMHEGIWHWRKFMRLQMLSLRHMDISPLKQSAKDSVVRFTLTHVLTNIVHVAHLNDCYNPLDRLYGLWGIISIAIQPLPPIHYTRKTHKYSKSSLSLSWRSQGAFGKLPCITGVQGRRQISLPGRRIWFQVTGYAETIQRDHHGLSTNIIIHQISRK